MPFSTCLGHPAGPSTVLETKEKCIKYVKSEGQRSCSTKTAGGYRKLRGKSSENRIAKRWEGKGHLPEFASFLYYFLTCSLGQAIFCAASIRGDNASPCFPG
jgi:hypothetical protein